MELTSALYWIIFVTANLSCQMVLHSSRNSKLKLRFTRFKGYWMNYRSLKYNLQLTIYRKSLRIRWFWQLKRVDSWKVGCLWLWQANSCEWRLLFRASRDGFASSVFHSKCDNKGPTITVVKSGGNIFGGFTENAWTSKINWYDSVLSTN